MTYFTIYYVLSLSLWPSGSHSWTSIILLPLHCTSHALSSLSSMLCFLRCGCPYSVIDANIGPVSCGLSIGSRRLLCLLTEPGKYSRLQYEQILPVFSLDKQGTAWWIAPGLIRSVVRNYSIIWHCVVAVVVVVDRIDVAVLSACLSESICRSESCCLHQSKFRYCLILHIIPPSNYKKLGCL